MVTQTWRELSCCGSQNIWQFNEITFALDSFNDAFGGIIFGAVISGGSHLAVYVIVVFHTASEPSNSFMTGLVLAFYCVQLVACAEVSRKVNLLSCFGANSNN